MKKATAEFIAIISDDEPLAKLRTSLDMDIDGLKCVMTEIYRTEDDSLRTITSEDRLAEYTEQVLGSMATRFAEYIAAVKFLAS